MIVDILLKLRRHVVKKSLKQIIIEKGYKQIEIAKHLEISESHVSLLIKGKRRMNIDRAYDLATVLGISIDELYVGLKAEV